jgi:hypothetical protein
MGARKMEASDDIIQRTSDLNRQSEIDYQGRVSNQSRFNNQQRAMTDDLNQRNLDQWRNQQSTAFKQLGQFGETLDKEANATAVLGILRRMYPKIYDRLIQGGVPPGGMPEYDNQSYDSGYQGYDNASYGDPSYQAPPPTYYR